MNQSQQGEKRSKKYKSPILQNSKTIYNSQRPNIIKRRNDSSSDDDDDFKIKNDHSDLLADVLGN